MLYLEMMNVLPWMKLNSKKFNLINVSEKIKFIHGDFLKIDLGDADFVFVNPNWIDAHSQVCFIDIFVRDIIFWLPIFTANDVGFNLFPLHSGHSTFDMYFSISFFE